MKMSRRTTLIAGMIAMAAAGRGKVSAAPRKKEEVDAMDDRFAILELTAAMGARVDARDWAALEALFAETVTVDYTSLWGGEPATMKAAELMAGWKGLVPGFTRTQHTIGVAAMEIAGDRATANAPVIGHHFIDDPAPAGGRSWVVGGRYFWELERKPESWRIMKLTLGAAWQEGNLDLPKLAGERAARQ